MRPEEQKAGEIIGNIESLLITSKVYINNYDTCKDTVYSHIQDRINNEEYKHHEEVFLVSLLKFIKDTVNNDWREQKR